MLKQSRIRIHYVFIYFDDVQPQRSDISLQCLVETSSKDQKTPSSKLCHPKKKRKENLIYQKLKNLKPNIHSLAV